MNHHVTLDRSPDDTDVRQEEHAPCGSLWTYCQHRTCWHPSPDRDDKAHVAGGQS